MALTDRQNRLLLAEDWKRVYQTFRNADFKSYDFDTLRRTMINYRVKTILKILTTILNPEHSTN